MNNLLQNRAVWTLFILTILILSSCGASKQFDIATTLGTVQAYENFLEEHPNSSYAKTAAFRLKSLYEMEAWNDAEKENTASSYKKYLESYPDGKNAAKAKSLISKREREEKIEADWKRAISANSINAYTYFLTKHPNSPYSAMARSSINRIIDADWDTVKDSNSTEKLYSFIKKYPNSQYVNLARSKISSIREMDAWNEATSQNSISAYTDYLRNYPSAKHSSLAKSRIKEIEEERFVLPAWNKALNQDTYQAYKSFYNQYPNSSYAYRAKAKIEAFENTAWSKASSANTINSYKSFLNNYPNSDMSEIARKRIIDLEVENIFKGDYGYLPPMNKTSTYGYGQSRPSYNEIQIFNDTSYELTVWYSGATSKKIVLSPRRSTSFTLPNGSYKVAASVKASNVTKYAGNENLTGGSYESKFYIQTRSGFNF